MTFQRFSILAEEYNLFNKKNRKLFAESDSDA